jgi:hypothetical protein
MDGNRGAKSQAGTGNAERNELNPWSETRS